MMAENVISLDAWKGKLQTGKQGPKKTVTNLMLCLENIRELGATIRFNDLSQVVEWNGKPLEEHHLIDIRVILESAGFEANARDVLPAVIRHARRHSYHPVRDYLSGLEWDGRKRLDHWLKACLGAPDKPFTSIAGRKTLIAAVARAFQPGCKVDTVLILEGPQGIRKSSAIAALFGQEFTLESIDVFANHKHMVMNIMGKWVVELAEFVAALRHDEEKVKGLITMRTDRVALNYARSSSDHPRGIIFIGTYNPDGLGYFADTTGNRRYWPINVTKVDLDMLAAKRDQIWAEAVHAYRAGEQWWLDDREEALACAAVGAREKGDIWTELMEEKLLPYTRIKTSSALKLLGIPEERLGDKGFERRMGKVMRTLGWRAQYPKDEDRKTYRVWVRPGEGE